MDRTFPEFDILKTSLFSSSAESDLVQANKVESIPLIPLPDDVPPEFCKQATGSPAPFTTAKFMYSLRFSDSFRFLLLLLFEELASGKRCGGNTSSKTEGGRFKLFRSKKPNRFHLELAIILKLRHCQVFQQK
jgi:hypothetical protein